MNNQVPYLQISRVGREIRVDSEMAQPQAILTRDKKESLDSQSQEKIKKVKKQNLHKPDQETKEPRQLTGPSGRGYKDQDEENEDGGENKGRGASSSH